MGQAVASSDIIETDTLQQSADDENQQTSNNNRPVSSEGGKTYREHYVTGVASHACEAEPLEPQPERTSVIFLEDALEGSPVCIGDLDGSQVLNVRDFDSLGPEALKLTEYLFSLCRPRTYRPLEQDDDDEYDGPILNTEEYFYSPNTTTNNNPVPQTLTYVGVQHRSGQESKPLPDLPQTPSGEGPPSPKVVGVGNVLRSLGRKLIRKDKQPSTQGFVPNEHTQGFISDKLNVHHPLRPSRSSASHPATSPCLQFPDEET